jgi:plasmid stabilization system protein ParE
VPTADSTGQTGRSAHSLIVEAVERHAAYEEQLRTLLGRPLHGDIRELVISYGRTGYVALYRFVVGRDEVRILAMRHQRELGFAP